MPNIVPQNMTFLPLYFFFLLITRKVVNTFLYFPVHSLTSHDSGFHLSRWLQGPGWTHCFPGSYPPGSLCTFYSDNLSISSWNTSSLGSQDSCLSHSPPRTLVWVSPPASLPTSQIYHVYGFHKGLSFSLAPNNLTHAHEIRVVFSEDSELSIPGLLPAPQPLRA